MIVEVFNSKGNKVVYRSEQNGNYWKTENGVSQTISPAHFGSVVNKVKKAIENGDTSVSLRE